jgi:hypothetical protein
LPRFWPVLSLVILAVLLGCSGAGIESAYFGPPGTIERIIMRYYERHASEGNCFNPYIDGFTTLTALEDTPDRLVVRARYFYRDRFQDGGGGSGQLCAGFNERTFVLGRDADGAPIVVGMTGEQNEPAIRSLIRRMLPG